MKGAFSDGTLTLNRGVGNIDIPFTSPSTGSYSKVTCDTYSEFYAYITNNEEIPYFTVRGRTKLAGNSGTLARSNDNYTIITGNKIRIDSSTSANGSSFQNAYNTYAISTYKIVQYPIMEYTIFGRVSSFEANLVRIQGRQKVQNGYGGDPTYSDETVEWNYLNVAFGATLFLNNSA